MALVSKVRKLFQAKRRMFTHWSATYLATHLTGTSSLGTIVMRNNTNKVAKVELAPQFQMGINLSVPSTADVLYIRWNAFVLLALGALESESYLQSTAVSAVSAASTTRSGGIASNLNRPLLFTIPPLSDVTITVTLTHITPAQYIHSGAVTVSALTTGMWWDTSNMMMLLGGIADEGVTVVSGFPFPA